MFFRIEPRELSFSQLFLVLVMGCNVVSWRLGDGLFFSGKSHRRVVHNGLYLFKGDCAGVEIKLRANDLPALAVFAFVGSRHRTLDGFDHGLAADASILELPE